MATKIPLLRLCNLNSLPSGSLFDPIRSAFRQYGAIRLEIPKDIRYLPGIVFQNASQFFGQPIEIKNKIQGYSPFASELAQGKTPFPKESIYLFRDGAVPKDLKDLTPEFYHSVKTLYDTWTPLRLDLLRIIPKVLGADESLMATPLLKSATLAVHYYDSRNVPDGIHFSPSHRDPGMFTILHRSYDKNDGLEIADLQTTEKKGSEEIGSDATFENLPTAHNEVILMAGTRLEKTLGSDLVRACVHRVRGPGSGYYNNPGSLPRRYSIPRSSIPIFFAPPVPSEQRPPPLSSSSTAR